MNYALFVLALFGRCIARGISSASSDTDYHGTECHADTSADANESFPGGGFRLYGAFGESREDTTDPLTLAPGFNGSGEIPGISEHVVEDAAESSDGGTHENRWGTTGEGLADTSDLSDESACYADTPAERAARRSFVAKIRRDADEMMARVKDAEDSDKWPRPLARPAHDALAAYELAHAAAERLYWRADELAAEPGTSGRWAHVRDAHLADMAAMERALAAPVAAPAPLPGEMEFWQAERDARFARLRRFALRAKRQGRWEQLAALKKGITERYTASRSLPSFRVYLTRAQVDYLSRV